MPFCKACRAPIEFVRTENGRNMPVDAKLQSFVTVDEEGIGRVRKGHLPHWASCTRPEEFRGGGRQLNLVMPGVRTPIEED